MYDAKQFWQMVKSVSDKPYNSVDISVDRWFSHFTDVFSSFDSVEDSEFDDNFNSNVDLENDTDYNICNGDITDDDIINAVKDLNVGKAGVGNLVVNHFKYGIQVLLPYIRLLFNRLFRTGEYPGAWSQSVIIPLHKKAISTIQIITGV